MTFASVQELIQGTRQAIQLNGGLRVTDPSALRGETIDRLAHTAVFGEGDARDAARWLIWEVGWEVGVKSASIDPLYQARAREEYTNVTVPAMNVRRWPRMCRESKGCGCLQMHNGFGLATLQRSPSQSPLHWSLRPGSAL